MPSPDSGPPRNPHVPSQLAMSSLGGPRQAALRLPSPGAGLSRLRARRAPAAPPAASPAAGAPMETTGLHRAPHLQRPPSRNLRFKTNIVIKMQMHIRLP